MKGGSDYCLINTQTKYSHLLTQIHSGYVESRDNSCIDLDYQKSLSTVPIVTAQNLNITLFVFNPLKNKTTKKNFFLHFHFL